jgi:hypothetical protein
VGLTPHQVAVDRAQATVALINQTMAKMQGTGELHEINQAFKAARAAEPSLRYADYLEARKAAMVESIAHQAACWSVGKRSAPAMARRRANTGSVAAARSHDNIDHSASTVESVASVTEYWRPDGITVVPSRFDLYEVAVSRHSDTVSLNPL